MKNAIIILVCSKLQFKLYGISIIVLFSNIYTAALGLTFIFHRIESIFIYRQNQHHIITTITVIHIVPIRRNSVEFCGDKSNLSRLRYPKTRPSRYGTIPVSYSKPHFPSCWVLITVKHMMARQSRFIDIQRIIYILVYWRFRFILFLTSGAKQYCKNKD